MQLTPQQQTHFINLLQQKFISQYKIIYMVDQKEADYFKHHFQNGCCSHARQQNSEKDTKLIKLMREVTGKPFLVNHMDQLLSYCHQRYSNIVESGRKENMMLTNEVQKFLIDKVLSQGVNHYLHKEVMERVKRESERMSSQIGLWATPATWYAKYPNIQLQIIEGWHLQQLNTKKYVVIEKIIDKIEGLHEELILLEKDGRFEQILQQKEVEEKVLRNPECYMGEHNYFPILTKTLIKVHSLPFQLNKKINSYLTVAESLKISYFKDQIYLPLLKTNKCKYHVIFNIGSQINVTMRQNSIEQVQPIHDGSLMIIDSEMEYGYEQMKANQLFVISNHICSAQTK